ncbi:MAG: GNAT family protein [Acidimicrobiales bacterium]
MAEALPARLLALIHPELSRLAGQDLDPDEMLGDVMSLDSLALVEVMLVCEDALREQAGADLTWLVDAPVDSLSARVIAERTAERMTARLASRSADAPTIAAELMSRVRLRPVHEPDAIWLRELMQRPSNAHQYVFRGLVGSPHRFLDLLTGDAVASFVAELPDGSAGIGFASVLSMDPSAGHASLGIVLTPEARDSTWAAAVFLNLADYAFTTFRLRKVYLQVPDFNIDLLSLARAHHLVAEGRMEDYHYHDGRLWGVNFVSFSVDRFTALCGRATSDG